MRNTKIPNLFIVEPLFDTMMHQEIEANLQGETCEDEARIQSPTMKRRIIPTRNKNMLGVGNKSSFYGGQGVVQ